MKRRLLVLLFLLPVVVVAPVPDARAALQWRMVVWMQPPMDATGDDACLRQDWHGPNATGDDQIHALDWAAGCPTEGSKAVRFRAYAANLDGSGLVRWAQGEPVQNDPRPCGGGLIRLARVKIRSTWDNLVKGKSSYGHVDVTSTAPFDIYFQGGNWTTSAYNNKNVADTKADPVCWSGYHVHENNSNDASWTFWNTALYTGGAQCDCYKTDDRLNWTRRIEWIDD